MNNDVSSGTYQIVLYLYSAKYFNNTRGLYIRAIMKPNAKLFISSPDVAGLFGDGKWRLLHAIKQYGSIQKAAQELGRSYRKAWGDIKRAEEGTGRQLVTKVRGGTSGGSTQLTDFGLQLLREWELYRNEVQTSLEQSYNRHLKRLLHDRTH